MGEQRNSNLWLNIEASNSIGRVLQCDVLADNKWPIGSTLRILGAYAVVYVLNGQCRYVHPDGRCQDFVSGDFFWVFPDLPHRYGPAPGKSYDEFYIKFDGPVFDLWREGGVLDPQHFAYHLQPVEYWLGRFRAMVQAWPAASPFSIQPICQLQAILAEIIESHGRSPVEKENVAWLQQAYELLAASDSTAMLEMESIADRLGMSYANFRKKFTSLARMSPGRYHTLLVMRRACRYLQEQPISSKEIAHLLGFCDQCHFSRRFKKVIGVTPSEYRDRSNPATKAPTRPARRSP